MDCFPKLISLIFEDDVPGLATSRALNEWISADNILTRWLPNIDSVLAAVGDSEFPVDGLYRSETERAMLFHLPTEDREEVMSQGYENFHGQSQPQVGGVGCCLNV